MVTFFPRDIGMWRQDFEFGLQLTNKRSKIDLSKHPYYVGHHLYNQWTTRILDCEVLSISFTTGSCRVRIINPDTGEYYTKNCDTSTCYLVGLDLTDAI